MNIVLVCLGNICRSPMAEFVCKDIIKKQGLSGINVSSRATSSEEVGNPVYPPAGRELAKHGITCGGKFAEQLRASDYDKADLFVCMDESNVRNAKRIFGGDGANKTVKLLSYCGEDSDIADPWYTGNFALTYSQIERGCNALLKSLQNK